MTGCTLYNSASAQPQQEKFNVSWHLKSSSGCFRVLFNITFIPGFVIMIGDLRLSGDFLLFHSLYFYKPNTTRILLDSVLVKGKIIQRLSCPYVLMVVKILSLSLASRDE